MLTKLLQGYWFSAREAKIYLTCLEFGEDVVSSIARRAGENRVTTYSILKDLTLRGIANEVIKNNKKYYSVISPEKLVKKQEDKYKKLKEALPELMAITSEYAHKAKVLFYEGFDGIKDIYEDAATQGTEILIMRGTSSMSEKMKNYIYQDFQNQRIENKTPIRLIYSQGYKKKFNLSDQEAKDQHFREILIINHPIFKIENDIIIYGPNKVAMIMFGKWNMSGVIVESMDMRETYKNIFDTLRFLGKRYEESKK